MERMNGETLNIVTDNINKLKEIFPEVFNEDKVDFEKLEVVLGEYKDNGTERYNFSWPGKSKAIRISQTPSTGTLRPFKEESKDWDTTQNLYIEGDNLEVLKLLQKAYYGKVKMIYIDPPYNTGSDFVYKDDFKDNIENYLEITGQKDLDGNKITTNTEANGRYHSNWLNMMYPRLRLARNLLKDDGVIFISIDDNEVDNLKRMLDEIYGEENFLGRIMPVVNPGGRDYKQIALTHEYLLVYCKSDLTELQEITKEIEFKMYDSMGGYEVRDLRNRNPKFHSGNRPNLFYPFYVNPDIKDEYGCCGVSLEKGNGYNIEIKPYNSIGKESVWRWGRIKANQNIVLGDIDKSQIVAKPKNDGGWTISEKNRRSTTKVKSIWSETEMRTEEGTRLIRKIFGFTPFDHPKPVGFIKRLIEMAGESDIILDFFSGSGSTAQAIMESNLKDGMNRKFIMIQLPEEVDEKTEAYKNGYRNICEIGKDRIRKVGEKLIEENKDLDIGFKVFKLDSSNINKWDSSYEQDLEHNLLSSIENIKEGRVEEDILYEVLIKYGIDLNMPIEEHIISGKKVFDIGFGAIIACLDNNVTVDVVEGIGKLKEQLNPDICRVVFMDNGFISDSVKTNAVQILKRYNIEDVKSI